MKKHNQTRAGLARSIRSTGRDAVTWYDESGHEQSGSPTPKILHRKLHLARRARTGSQYKGKSNYQGMYWLSQLDQHVWYESLFELTAMTWLDYEHGIHGFSSQPMLLSFNDGTAHFPDFFALHEDGTQVVYDVKPAKLLDSAKQQFANTQRICDAVGWQYELFTDIDEFTRVNLEWLLGYRNPRYAPDDETRERLRDAATVPLTFSNAVRLADEKHPRRGIHVIANMLWTHHLRFDIDRQLTPLSSIWRP